MSSNYTDHSGCWGKRAPVISFCNIYIVAILSSMIKL